MGDAGNLSAVIDDQPHVAPAVQHPTPVGRRTVEPLRFELPTERLVRDDAAE
jgi:hypothetical protein